MSKSQPPPPPMPRIEDLPQVVPTPVVEEEKSKDPPPDYADVWIWPNHKKQPKNDANPSYKRPVAKC